MTRIAPGLDQLIDLTKPVFYLNLGVETVEVPIRRVGMDYIILDLNEALSGKDRIKGFVTAKEGRGIIPIECKVTTEKSDEDRFDVLFLKFNPDELKLINQREFYRLATATKEAGILQTPDGRTHPVEVVNISAGGVGFIAPEFLSAVPIYQLSFPLWNTGITFTLAVKIVYYKKKKLPTDESYHGAQFIKNASLTAFPILTKNNQEKIIQGINRRLMDLRKIKDN